MGDLERTRARGELEELKLEAERVKMAGEEAREALSDAIAVFHPIELIQTGRVAFLAAQLVDAAAKLQNDIRPAMVKIRERYNL
jgi:hypothetical protein